MLVNAIDEHPSEFEYDWRTRFGLSIRAVFDGTQTWREAVALMIELVHDPTSRLAVAIAGWDHPWSTESAILADVYDLMQYANTERKHRSRVEPYPRPYRTDGKARSKRPTVSQATIRAALAARGH